MSSLVDPRVRAFRASQFCRRPGSEPELLRASGDSGFVTHLSSATHGATGWDWSFRLVKLGDGWQFVSDGKVTVFLDEPGYYVPNDAKVGDLVAVRLPRARENFFPHRFSLYGGQGGPVIAQGFVKLFIPVSFEQASTLVEAFAARGADQLRFALHVANSPLDFDRADSAIVDVAVADEPGVLKILDGFRRTNAEALVSRPLPYGTAEGPPSCARALAHGRSDLGDGFGWRVSHEAVATGKA